MFSVGTSAWRVSMAGAVVGAGGRGRGETRWSEPAEAHASTSHRLPVTTAKSNYIMTLTHKFYYSDFTSLLLLQETPQCDETRFSTIQPSNPKLRLDVSYPYSKFGVNRPKQTKVIERKLKFYFSNTDFDLDHKNPG